MGPLARFLGPWVPEPQLWQDPVPGRRHARRRRHRRRSRTRCWRPASRSADLVSTAWASASTFRGTDKRGGANGARIRLEPQKDWAVNEPACWPRCSTGSSRSAATRGIDVSLADLIVLGGCAAVEKAAADAGFDVTVPFTPGAATRRRSRPTSTRSPCSSPSADGFRNYQQPDERPRPSASARPRQLLDAHRARDDGAGRRHAGARRELTAARSTACSPTASAADQRLVREPARHAHEWTTSAEENVYEVDRQRRSGRPRPPTWCSARNSQLRALAEVYAVRDARKSSCATSSRPGPRS